MPVELILGAVSAADLCLKYGKILLKFYRDFKGAHKDLEEKILQVEAVWHKTDIQIRIIKKIDSRLGEDQRRVQEDLLEKLSGALSLVCRKLESKIKPNSDGSSDGALTPYQSFKYALAKESIEKTLHSLELWHKLYDPTWFLITLMTDSLLDTEIRTVRPAPSLVPSASSPKTLSALNQLRSLLHGGTSSSPSLHVNLDPSQFDVHSATPVRYTNNIRIYTRQPSSTSSSSQPRTFIIDTIQIHAHTNVSVARSDAECLARTLKSVEPETFNLLRCQGIVKSRSPKTQQLEAIHLLFRSPSSPARCRSLREMLLTNPPNRTSLTKRLEIARGLANSVAFVHVCNLVHKNIRPETVLAFDGPNGSGCSQGVYLLGFDGFRSVNYQTMKLGDSAWERNVYRHPSRMGINVQEEYVMQHDIYALGVLMLEIGMWSSFVGYEGDEKQQMSVGKGLMSVAAGLELESWNDEESRNRLKEGLVSMAKEELPASMGERYTDAVVACLTCLDEDNPDFGGTDVKDEDGVVIGVRFIEKILWKLNEILL